MAEHPAPNHAELNQIPPNIVDHHPGEEDPIPQNAPAPNPGEDVPIPQNAPAPNPGEDVPIPQIAPAPNLGEDVPMPQNAPSGWSTAWTYFIDHLSDFWPPIPSRIVSKITSNVVFRPPPTSYDIVGVNGQATLQLNPDVPAQLTEEQRLQINVFTAVTSNQNTIVCMFIPIENPRFTLFVSHGHDVDIGLRCSFYFELGIRLECNVFAYDYSGYGLSNGIASEENMYADATAALEALTSRYDVTEQEIVYYGHSLGTAAAIKMANRLPASAGLILISPFKSGLRVLFPDMPFTCCFDCFPNVDRMKNVWCRTQIIEPRNDELFGSNNGQALSDRLPHDLPAFILRLESGHNDIEESEVCLARLHHFITHDAGLPVVNNLNV